MKYLSTALVLALATSYTPVHANVCGSSVSRFLVPDYICFDAQGGRVPYANCMSNRTGGTLVRKRIDFSTACSKHDNCYGTRGTSKADCDAKFYESLKLACRSQISDAGAEKLFSACIDTALQFNDVVRGQATRRVGLWMVQQVPFSGQSGCEAYITAQKRTGELKPSCTTESTTALIGRWNDGGPGCASIKRGSSARHLVLRAWYCEANESRAKPVVVEHDATIDAYVHELTGLSLKLLSNGQIEIAARGNIRERLGESTFLAEEVKAYSRDSAVALDSRKGQNQSGIAANAGSKVRVSSAQGYIVSSWTPAKTIKTFVFPAGTHGYYKHGEQRIVITDVNISYYNIIGNLETFWYGFAGDIQNYSGQVRLVSRNAGHYIYQREDMNADEIIKVLLPEVQAWRQRFKNLPSTAREMYLSAHN